MTNDHLQALLQVFGFYSQQEPKTSALNCLLLMMNRLTKLPMTTIRQTGDRYEISLLWKDKVNLPNNYNSAKAHF